MHPVKNNKIDRKTIVLNICEATISNNYYRMLTLLEHASCQELLKKEPDLLNNICIEGQYYPLHKAVCYGNFKMVQLLMDHDADPDKLNKDCHSPLGLAVKNEKIFYCMLNHEKYTPSLAINLAIVDAVAENNYPVTQALLNKATQANLCKKNPEYLLNNAFRSPENYPLHLAVQQGNPDMVQLLMDHDADPDKLNKDCRSPLGLAVKNKGIFDCILNHKKYKPSNNMCFAIVDAVADNDYDATQALLNKATQAGVTQEGFKALLNNAFRSPENYPLHLAVQQGNPDMVQLLMDHDADPDKLNKDCRSPLGLAVKNKGIFDCILNHKKYKPSNNMCFAIVDAVVDNDYDATQALLNKATQANLCKENPEYLLNNAFRSPENYPLHLAVQHNNPQMVQLLMDHGADPHKKNKSNFSPLELVINKPTLLLIIISHPLFKITQDSFNKIQHVIFDAIDADNYELAENLLIKAKKVKKLEEHSNFLNEIKHPTTKKSPLQYAMTKNRDRITRLLQDNGAIHPLDKEKSSRAKSSPITTEGMKQLASSSLFTSSMSEGEEQQEPKEKTKDATSISSISS